MDYLHLFNLSALIVKLSFSQGSIPCNLCLFNIREFALEEGVSKNFIILNPSFLTWLSYCPIPSFPCFAPLPLSFFMPCLSCCPPPLSRFLPLLFSTSLFGKLVPSLSFLLSTLLVLLEHTHFPYLPLFYLAATHTPCPSLCPTYPLISGMPPPWVQLPYLPYTKVLVV